jgi:hypothetical protein
MQYVLVLFIALFLHAPAPAVGQEALAVEPGTRVRVVLARGSRSIWSRPQILQGTVTALNADSISLRLDAGAGPVTLATASIAQLEVSRGVPSRLESAVWQGAVLGRQGAVYWPILTEKDRGSSDSWDRDMLVGAAVGTAIGVVVGALDPAERWRIARKGPAPGEFTIPEPVPSPRIALGGGVAMLDEGRVSGVGQHVQATVHLTPRARFLKLRGELLHARSDRTRQYGAGVSAVGDAWYTWGPFQPYGIPLGIGVYHRQTRSSASREPAMSCLVGEEGVSCPSTPPFETFRYTTQTTGFGVNTGGGIRTRVGDAQLFVELRFHTVLERGGYSGSLPLTFGIGF